ncbi:outer membrane lipoprotein-sorting protein [Hyalangium versicolor]|uniref:outer membrane lipoprotein-sorting protein n=1 Tax=Hyalangium versicolor TaxID=2861190 RepID=UPI001CC97CEF|nr:outer membrane lipoprotein-sorting protein [Hyalangium versicolor]
MRAFWIAAVALLVAEAAWAKDPTAEELLQRYDEVMGPRTFEAESQMTAWREDGSSRSYEMRMLKAEDDKSRIWFKAPASVKGQEILRVGDNLWVYLPNLKRATRMANRDSFQGGDFNNADILRVNYSKDYAGKLVPSDSAETWALELKAKSQETAYDAIKLWLRKSDGLPVKAQYFGTSGQMLRSAEFSDYTELEKGYTRPAKVVMRNELVKSRRSELVVKSLKRGVEAPAQRFTQADLGR